MNRWPTIQAASQYTFHRYARSAFFFIRNDFQLKTYNSTLLIHILCFQPDDIQIFFLNYFEYPKEQMDNLFF